MAAIVTEIVGVVTSVGTAFLTAGSVLQYVVGFAIVGFIWSRVARAIRR